MVSHKVIVGGTHFVLSKDNLHLKLDALIVNDLDVDILAGISFMAVNDISVRPTKPKILIGDTYVVHYGISYSNKTAFVVLMCTS